MKVKRLLAGVIKVCIAVVVMAFLGLKSYDFFLFTTPEGESYYALLGFGMTGIGLVAYLFMFMWDADTPLKKTVSIIMIAVCGVGEVATAGFGMQIEAWKNQGFIIDTESFKAMIWVVQLLGFAHAAALVAYLAGDKLAEAFGDEDGDGIPNAFDKDYKGKKHNQSLKPARQFGAESVSTPNPTQAGNKSEN